MRKTAFSKNYHFAPHFLFFTHPSLLDSVSSLTSRASWFKFPSTVGNHRKIAKYMIIRHEISWKCMKKTPCRANCLIYGLRVIGTLEKCQEMWAHCETTTKWNQKFTSNWFRGRQNSLPYFSHTRDCCRKSYTRHYAEIVKETVRKPISIRFSSFLPRFLRAKSIWKQFC